MSRIKKLKAFCENNTAVTEFIIADLYALATQNVTNFVCFDGGAHKGFHTKRLLHLPGCEKVYAVDADPKIAADLRDIIRRDLPGEYRIEVIDAALQASPDVNEVAWRSCKSHDGRSTIDSQTSQTSTIWSRNNSVEYDEPISVDATTIDRVLLNEARAIGFMKLDLEGGDIPALFGARETLATKRPICVFENSILAPEVYGFTISETEEFLDTIDYCAIDFVGDRMDATNWFGFYESWAVPNEHAEWFSKSVSDIVARRML